MVASTMIQYVFIVLLINSSLSVSDHQISARIVNDGDVGDVELQEQPRKLTDEEEIVTYSNSINDDSSAPSKVVKLKNDIQTLGGVAKDYQYFNDASSVSTPKYESKHASPKYESLQFAAPVNYDSLNYEQPKYAPPLPPLPPSIKIPSNFKIDESDLAHSYYTQFDPSMSYVSSDTFIGNQPVHTIPASALDEPYPISHIAPNHLIKVIHQPSWAPEIQRLENHYLDTYHTIKTSVLSFYYKMEYIANYLMGIFNFAGELKT